MGSLGLSDFCEAQNVTYDHRAFDPDARNWCPVPGGGADALLFAGLSVFVSCALYSKLSAVWVLMAGGVFEFLAFRYNLNHFSNAITIWLGMHPSTIFLQIFLPPLLLDSAVRVDFFLFKKMAAHCLLFALVNVVVCTLAFIPLMLKGLGVGAAGWRAVDAALFGAILGSTDAVAVTAILKGGGAPEMLSVLLEGESLFNDASSIVLFEIFLEMSAATGQSEGSLGEQVGNIVSKIGYLAATGAACGVLMGVLTRLFYKLLQKRGVPPAAEVAVSLAGAYTVYLGTEYYLHGSGVIGVVVYGLYGASTYLYGLSSKGVRQGAFFKFWDVVSFVLNGMVFFFVGTYVCSFFLTINPDHEKGGKAAALLFLAKNLPPVLVAMLALRWLLMTLEAPLLSLVGPRLSWKELLFSTVGGLRGGMALILAQSVLSGHGTTRDEETKAVHAQMAMLTAAVVLFSLTVNAPLLGPLMTALGLNKTTPAQRYMHKRAQAALDDYTRRTIADLKSDDDEMLRGVDWVAVTASSNLSKDVKRVLKGDKSRQLVRNITIGGGGGGADPGSWPEGADDPETGDSLASDLANSGSQILTQAALAGGGHSMRRRAPGSESGGLRVPLLGRQFSGRGAERYAGNKDSDEEDAEGDVEAGRKLASDKVPPVVVQSNSEAAFIANRLQAQEQELAQHAAEGADCPFLAKARAAAAEQADAAGSDSGSGPADAADELDDDGEADESGLAGLDSVRADEAAAAVAAAAAAEVKPEFKLLKPLVVARMSDALKASTSTLQLSSNLSGWPAPAARSGAAPRSPTKAGARRVTYDDAAASGAVAVVACDRYVGGGFWDGHRNANTSAVAVAEWRSGSAVGGMQGMPRPAGGPSSQGMRALSGFWPPRQSQEGPAGSRPPAARPGAGLSFIGSGSTFGGSAGPFASAAGVQEYDAVSVASDLSESLMTQEEFLEEYRVSLLVGLKRHFKFKAAEGLLSNTSLRMLCYGCDSCLSRPQQPLDFWSTVGKDIETRGLTPYLAALHYRLRRYRAHLYRSRSGGFMYWRWIMHAVLERISIFLRNKLAQVALTALEVALELWLALTASPQARMMRHSTTTASGMLQEELRAQAGVVWRFIMDRQIEAPDEFSSLQTHRVQLAVARRQLAFVEQLAQVGAVEEAAAEALQELVEHRLHRLEVRGPTWEPPSLMDVLRQQPFLAPESEGMLLWLRAYGELRSFQPGQCVVPRKRSRPPGIFIVISGLVRAECLRGNKTQTKFVGVGGCVGFVSSLLGQEMPGAQLVAAYGQGNALGRGPLLLHLPMRLLAAIQQRAAPRSAASSVMQSSDSFSDELSAASWQSRLLDPMAAAAATAAAATSGWGDDPVATAAAEAAAGEAGLAEQLSRAAFSQLLLDMYRQAGVMLLDRMGGAVLAQLSAHVETALQTIFTYTAQLPPAKAAPRLQRLLTDLLDEAAADGIIDILTEAAGASGVSAGTSGALPAAAAAAVAVAAVGQPGGARQLLDDSEAAGSLVAARVEEAAAKLRDSLRAADLVALAPGEHFRQGSSLLLLKGGVRANAAAPAAATSDQPRTGTGGSSRSLAQYAAPTLLAWGPDLFEDMDERYDSHARGYTAGSRGALLLVAPSFSGASSIAGSSSNDDLSDAAEADRLAAAAAEEAGGGGQGRQQQKQQEGRRLYMRLSSLLPLNRAAHTADSEHHT